MSAELYFILAGVFGVADILGGEISGGKSRFWISVVYGLTWPMSAPISHVLSAEVLRRYKETKAKP